MLPLLLFKDAIQISLPVEDTHIAQCVFVGSQVVDPDSLEAGNQPGTKAVQTRVFKFLKSASFRVAVKELDRLFDGGQESKGHI